MEPTAAALLADIRENAANRAILDRLTEIALPDVWLVAGALFETVWNLRSGQPPKAHINDYDIFYFDGTDLSWEGEDRHIRRVAALFADLDVTIELRNQARVHLWYRQRFGHDAAPLASSRAAIGSFLVACTCVGVGLAPDGSLELAAPYGLADLYGGVLRPNPGRHVPALFRAKADSYRARWPWLRVEEGEPV